MKSNHFGLVAAAMLLAGCQQEQQPIDQFITQVEQTSYKEIKQLEPEKPYKASEYQAAQLRQPFTLPEVALIATQPKVKKDCWQPAHRDKNGRLEKYPLSDLKLRGVMGRDGNVSGLIQTPEGTLVKIQAGQYIGLNNGRVTKVDEQHLQIKETLPDGLGCWQQRDVKLALK